MNKVVALALSVTLISALAACSEDDATESGLSVSQTITINDFLSSEPVEDVTLCWSLNGGEDTCLTTDANGQATGSVDFVAGDMLVLNATKDKYFPFRVEYYLDETTTGTVSATWAFINETLVDIVTAALGADADPAKGHVTVLLTDGTDPIEGATAEMTIGTAAQGPNYSNSDVTDGIFSDSGVTTDAGIVVFNNVDPGEVELTATVDGKTCVASAGENAGDNKVHTLIEAGKLSYTAMVCN